jgi:hypothetical protein
MKSVTKKHSPEVTDTYSNGELGIEVFYCSPSKKDRVIFGELVPYGEVWRTGANEASTFFTNQELLIGGKTLAIGKYSLFTIPNEDSWDIIFNNKKYGWGVSAINQKASRQEEHDALIVTATVSKSLTTQENLSIKVSKGSDGNPVLFISWDNVVAALPMKVK